MTEVLEKEFWQELPEGLEPKTEPLVKHVYTADPSAHSFNGRIYFYPSHDIDAGIPFNDNGDHFGMEDYHVFSMAGPGEEVVDHGVALHVRDVPWASRQMWAPDAACKDGKYYFYFPARNLDGKFQIGVAVSENPEGPFVPESEPIAGSYSIDPAVYQDGDDYYLYFGGIWGGQLQEYRDNQYSEINGLPEGDEIALTGKVAKLSADMKSMVEAPRDVVIVDEQGQPLKASDPRRFFEASWLHKFNDTYYFSYSTGDHHTICYATADNPYGPFTYGGQILEPVLGWTTHHSICEFNGQWYLFYHDSSLSEGVTHLRSVKMMPIEHDAEGKIKTYNAYHKK